MATISIYLDLDGLRTWCRENDRWITFESTGAIIMGDRDDDEELGAPDLVQRLQGSVTP